MKKCITQVLIIFVLLYLVKIDVYATTSSTQEDSVESYYNEFYDSVDLDALEKEIGQAGQKYNMAGDIPFKEIYSLLLEGKVNEALQRAIDSFFTGISNEIESNKALIVKLILLVIIAAVFNNYSSILKFSYVGEQGFYITYLLIAMLLMQSFSLAYTIAEEAVFYIKDIMECMLPAFYMSIIMCGGLSTSQMVNSMFLWMLSLVEKLLTVFVLPGIRIYFLIIVLNQINSKDRFSKLAGLIKQGIEFSLKAIVTVIIGLNIMKSMLVPVYENVKYNVLQKGLSVIPGGASLSGLSTILIAAGVLIKNSVGIAAVIVLLVLGSVPLLKLLYFYVIYKVILAFVQPISDARILAGLQGASDSTGILLKATATSIVLCVLSIAIVILTTNVKLYTS